MLGLFLRKIRKKNSNTKLKIKEAFIEVITLAIKLEQTMNTEITS